MTPAQIEFYKRLAHGLALQFGPNCEVVVVSYTHLTLPTIA